jgi:predicted glycosyltransferase
MKVLFHLGHPAHFHLFKNVIDKLKHLDHKILIVIKKKDVLEELLKSSNFEYFNILPNGRKDGKFNILIGQLIQNYKIYRICKQFKPDLLIGTSVAISHVGKLLKIPSINVNEDDAEVVPLYAKLAYPWAYCIISPKVCSVGKWEYKKINYEGYHELAYLHPNNFTPNINIVRSYNINTEEKYFIIRFAKLNAHHDNSAIGINKIIARKIINKLNDFGNIYITSERELEPEFEKYRININPKDIHHVMAFSNLFIGDSQTMSAESAVLGVPFIRFNNFVGRIGYLNELENKFKLGFGILISNEEKIYLTIDEILKNKNAILEWKEKRDYMLSKKIDVTSFLVWFINNFPTSLMHIKDKPEIVNRFKS